MINVENNINDKHDSYVNANLPRSNVTSLSSSNNVTEMKTIFVQMATDIKQSALINLTMQALINSGTDTNKIECKQLRPH